MPVRNSNYFIKAHALIICAILLWATPSLYAQTIPTAPNQRNTDGKRIGEWIITYTKNWKETSIADSIAFYRKITFDKTGKPQGKIYAYYKSGVLEFEGIFLQLEPEVIADGVCIWYHANGQKRKANTVVNGREEGLIKTWYDNGKPQYIYEKRNAQIEGIVRIWNEKGDSAKLYYENGKELDLSALSENVVQLYKQGRYTEASFIAEKCLKLTQLVDGENHPNYASSLNNLGSLYVSQGQYSKAEPLFIQVIAIRKKALGEEHPDYATSLSNLAELYKGQGEYTKAEPLYVQALTICKKALGEEHPDYADILNNLGQLYKIQGQYRKAEPLYVQALLILKKALGEEHSDYAKSLINLAGLYGSQSQYSKAEPIYLQALSTIKKTLGEEHPYYATSLNDLALLYLNQAQYSKAEPLLIQALAIRKKTLGEQHPHYAKSLINLAELYKTQGQYTKVEPLYVQALAISKKALGEEHPVYSTNLNNLASLYNIQGKYAKAESLYIQALAIHKKALGEEHPEYATGLSNLASLYESQGQYTKAEPLYIQALAIHKKALGEEHHDYTNSLSNLAALYINQGHYSKAEPLFIQALAIKKKTLGEEHPDYVASLSDLAVLYYSQGQYTKAEPSLIRALDIRKKVLGEEHPAYATSLNNLAELYRRQGQYTKAEPLYIQALTIDKKNVGEEHPDYAGGLNNLALLYNNQGQYTKAEPLFIQALAIKKKTLGEEHPDYANSMSNLALLYSYQGDYTKAESLYLQAVAIFKKALGDDHTNYAIGLNNLAELYISQGQYTKAVPVYVQALAIYKKAFGEEHPDYAASLNNLALLYDNQGHYSKAEPLFIQTATILKKSLGEGHSDYATSLNNLALLYDNQGQYAKAEPLFIQTAAILKKALGEEHPNYGTSLSNLGLLYHKQSQYRKAEPFFLQSIQIEKSNLLTFLETANQVQQEAYIRKREYIFNLNYSFGLLAKTPALITSTYESALLMKGVQLQSTTQLLNYIRQSKDTLLLAQHEQWLTLKRSINAQNNLPISKRAGVAVMKEQADSLYKIMARQSVALRNFKAAFQITPKAIQQKLKAQEAAIEFVHFKYRNSKRWTDSTFYAALVLRKDWTAPRMVYLCEQRALDSLLSLKGKGDRSTQYVNHIYGLDDSTSKAKQSKESSRGLPVGIELDKGKVLRSLYTLLWQPIDSLLSGVSTIYYSPSGLLNQINMAAIATPTPRQRLLDKYDQLIQLRSTREIVMPQEPVNYTQQALLMGSIEYNLDSLTYRRVNASYTQNRGGNSLSLPNSRGGIYDPLPATDEEISNSQTIMHTQKWKADTLKGLRASEEAFQYYASLKPRVIHLATHGFFLEDTLTRRKRDKELRFDKEPTLLTSGDPMQRSGLVLAGGNHAWQGKTPIANQADGLLTASEIGAMVLNNTELAVLSACETGLGDVKGAEGVFGLQRAFKMAGVKYLLMSLWKVNDEITSRFMQKFYENWLTKKMSVRSAYQHTLKQFRQDHPNPYDWAAFVLLE